MPGIGFGFGIAGGRTEGGSGTPAPTQRLLVAILTGQSNAQGRADREAEDTDVEGAYQYVTDDNHAAYGTIVGDITPTLGPDTYNADNPGKLTVGEYIARQVMEDGYYDAVLIVPCARGGTQMATPGDGWYPGDPGGSDFEVMVAEANAALAAAATAFPGHAIDRALYFVQGESDAQAETPRATYQASHSTFIATARSRITGASNMPFIIGSMVPELWSLDVDPTDEFKIGINAAHVQASLDITGVYYSRGYDGDDIPDNDNLHYQPAAIQRAQSRRLGAVLEAVRTGATGPAMTSSSTQTVVPDTTFSMALTAEGAHKTFHIVGGADAALFEISDPYLDPVLRGASNGPAPETEGDYVVQVAARDGLGNFGATQTITITVDEPAAPTEVSFVASTAGFEEIVISSPVGTALFEDRDFEIGLGIILMTSSAIPDSVTVNGVAATMVANSHTLSPASIWQVELTSAGSFDVAVTYSSSTKTTAILTGTLLGAEPTPVDTASRAGSTGSPAATSSALTVPVNGLGLAVARANPSTTFITWTAGAELDELGGGVRSSAVELSAGHDAAVSFSSESSSNQHIAAAAWTLAAE